MLNLLWWTVFKRIYSKEMHILEKIPHALRLSHSDLVKLYTESPLTSVKFRYVIKIFYDLTSGDQILANKVRIP